MSGALFLVPSEPSLELAVEIDGDDFPALATLPEVVCDFRRVGKGSEVNAGEHDELKLSIAAPDNIADVKQAVSEFDAWGRLTEEDGIKVTHGHGTTPPPSETTELPKGAINRGLHASLIFRTPVCQVNDTLTASPEVSDGVARTAPSVTPQLFRTHVAVTAVEMFARFFHSGRPS